jgi:RNA polymerase sigma factor (sigma-70 family)
VLDVGAIEDAYRRHGHVVLRRARRILEDDEEANAVLQEVFASLLDRPGQFGGKSTLLTWLYSATTHRCLNRLRDRRTQERLLEENRGRIVEGAPAPSAESRAAVREILGRVPEDLAQVAIYYYFDQLTHAEIAELLGCSRRHVGDLLLRFQRQALGQEATG